MSRRVRWTCPQCDKGALGPGRPRKNNAVRYCLPCTAKTGKLIERVHLAKERKNQRKVEAKKARKEQPPAPPKPRIRTKIVRLCPVTGRELTNPRSAADLEAAPRLDGADAWDIKRECRNGEGPWLDFRDLRSVEPGLHWRSRDSECSQIHEWSVRDLCENVRCASLARYNDGGGWVEWDWLSEEEEDKILRKQEVKVVYTPRPRKPKAPKPRRTKRSWMRDERYVVQLALADGAYEVNFMEAAEKICASSKWTAAVDLARKYRRKPTGYRNDNETAQRLWTRTMEQRGKKGSRGTIRIQRRQHRNSTSGRGGSSYGATVRLGKNPTSMGRVLEVLLHEVCHYVHLSAMDAEVINGKRRPHGMDFNLIQARMAQALWGYEFHPHEAGYSVGRGYAPSRHLEGWLNEQIRKGNPRVMRWLTKVEPASTALAASH